MTITEGPAIRRPILRYFGGKWRLAPWIISHFPEHEAYVEPFCGGASILLRKKRSRHEIINDVDSEIVNLFQVLRDPHKSKRLCELLQLTPFSRREYALAGKYTARPIERARRLIVRSFMGHGADSSKIGSKSGFRRVSIKNWVKGGNRNGATDWVNYPREIALFCERLQSVTVEEKDAIEIIQEFDSESTLFYVDPPYLHETRGARHNYAFEMNDQEHRQLIELLLAAKAMIVLSGYEAPLYMQSLAEWTLFKCEALADGSRKRTECLWLNPAAAQREKQAEFAF
jgi:DNA adenine methylase